MILFLSFFLNNDSNKDVVFSIFSFLKFNKMFLLDQQIY